MNPILVKRKDVEKMVGLTYPTFHRMEKLGKFPRRRKLTEGRVVWVYDELVEWASQLPEV